LKSALNQYGVSSLFDQNREFILEIRDRTTQLIHKVLNDKKVIEKVIELSDEAESRIMSRRASW